MSSGFGSRKMRLTFCTPVETLIGSLCSYRRRTSIREESSSKNSSAVAISISEGWSSPTTSFGMGVESFRRHQMVEYLRTLRSVRSPPARIFTSPVSSFADHPQTIRPYSEKIRSR
ncbi:hypothetical protein DSECCO2_529830 [anaerobic digester metagenome]